MIGQAMRDESGSWPANSNPQPNIILGLFLNNQRIHEPDHPLSLRSRSCQRLWVGLDSWRQRGMGADTPLPANLPHVCKDHLVLFV